MSNTQQQSTSAWQTVQIARHAERPLFLDYVAALFTEFDELHGDRAFADDQALIGGLARFQGKPVMIIGQQKGRNTREKIFHNFGMPNPEGYRKAARLFSIAERFHLPIITFIDTPGAYPGIEAEERGQAEAIAANLAQMSVLKVPIISLVIGEGGSGGALAIGVADILMMLSHSVYSVISPEGCASILFKTSNMAEKASEAMGMTAASLKKQGLVDVIIDEEDGAHLHNTVVMQRVRDALNDALTQLSTLDADALVAKRYARLMRFSSVKS